MQVDALSQLVLLPQALGAVGLASAPDTTVALPTSGSERSFHWNLPVVVRQLGPTQLGVHWEAFCTLLRKHGIPLYSGVESLEPISAASVPARFGRRRSHEGLSAEELKTADAFELDLHCGENTPWGWPPEAAADVQWESLVIAVREAAAGDTPVGVTLPIGGNEADLRRCVESGIDFLTLVAPRLDHVDPLVVWGLTQARKLCEQHGREELPILVDVPLRRTQDIGVCLALGASVVCVDPLLVPRIPSEPRGASAETHGGMLSGIAPVATQPALTEVEEALQDMRSVLVTQMHLCGATDLLGLDRNCLRGATTEIARLAGVPSL